MLKEEKLAEDRCYFGKDLFDSNFSTKTLLNLLIMDSIDSDYCNCSIFDPEAKLKLNFINIICIGQMSN